MRVLRVDYVGGKINLDVLELINPFSITDPARMVKTLPNNLPSWARERIAILNIAATGMGSNAVEVPGVGVKYPRDNIYRLIPPEGVKL